MTGRIRGSTRRLVVIAGAWFLAACSTDRALNPPQPADEDRDLGRIESLIQVLEHQESLRESRWFSFDPRQDSSTTAHLALLRKEAARLRRASTLSRLGAVAAICITEDYECDGEGSGSGPEAWWPISINVTGTVTGSIEGNSLSLTSSTAPYPSSQFAHSATWIPYDVDASGTPTAKTGGNTGTRLKTEVKSEFVSTALPAPHGLSLQTDTIAVQYNGSHTAYLFESPINSFRQLGPVASEDWKLRVPPAPAPPPDGTGGGGGEQCYALIRIEYDIWTGEILGVRLLATYCI